MSLLILESLIIFKSGPRRDCRDNIIHARFLFLAAYNVTDTGLEWSRKNRNIAGGVANNEGYSLSCFEIQRILLGPLRWTRLELQLSGGEAQCRNGLFIKMTLCNDVEHGAGHSGVNANAANVGKRSAIRRLQKYSVLRRNANPLPVA
jgi:hypothetical protein